ncbi:CHAD domain-containing protein [Novosphingobium sp. RD2P27]|uniref:CHAD domain-containing protein n=1 Tax=Novosphingobium kalidii TaxID=3230299 RepID=A0ABV2D204_9SPHN
MDEVELKLTIAGDAVASLKDSDVLAAEPEVRLLHAVYHDTPDHALAGAGFSLRIRATGKKRVQTVKADGGLAAGLFVRSEWETPVGSNAPVIDDSTPLKAMLGDRTEEVAPIFEVDVERSIWTLHEGDAEIELVLDIGQVHAGSSSESISEIELELKRGGPAALFDLARKLDAAAPLRLGVLSKAERGYRLTRPKRSVFKAEPVALDGEMKAAEAFQRIVQACLRQFRLNEAVLLEERSAEALHQARVALRRLRSAFSIFKPLIGADQRAASLRDELRWLAGELGNARNLDVLVDRVSAGKMRKRLKAAREEAYASVEATLASPRTRSLFLDLVEWLAAGKWLRAAKTQAARNEPAREFAASALNRLRRKVKKGGSDLEETDDETRHEVRKDAKKLRYASEFFAGLFDRKRERRRHKRFLSALEDLQDHLGALNDLATAPEEMIKLGLQDNAEAQKLLKNENKGELIAKAAEAHEALVDAKRFWR